MKTLIPLALLLTALAQAQQGNSVTITISAAGSVVLAGAGATFTANGSAVITGLGSAPFFATGTVASLNSFGIAGSVTGTYVIVYANGDLLTGQITIPAGFIVPSLGVAAGATGSMTVTGGTGTFAGASGSFSNVMGSGTSTGPVTSTLQASGSGAFKAPAWRMAGTLVYAGAMAHLAAGAGWKTTIMLVNSGAAAAQARVSFFDDGGNPLALPLTFPQGGTPPVSASTFMQTIRPGAEFAIESQGDDATLRQGSAQLFTDGNVTALLIFRYNPTGQEASVPLQVQNAASYTLAFDNTGGLATGVAIANVAAQAAAVPVIVRDETGASIATDTIRLAAQGHLSFVLLQQYAATAGLRGTLEFQTPVNGQLSVLAIRAAASGAYTTIPSIAK